MVTDSQQLVQPPLVVAYDVMREASNRLQGRIIALARAEGGAPAREQALADCSRIQVRVDAVDPGDRDAIAKLDAELRAEFAALPRP